MPNVFAVFVSTVLYGRARVSGIKFASAHIRSSSSICYNMLCKPPCGRHKPPKWPLLYTYIKALFRISGGFIPQHRGAMEISNNKSQSHNIFHDRLYVTYVTYDVMYFCCKKAVPRPNIYSTWAKLFCMSTQRNLVNQNHNQGSGNL